MANKRVLVTGSSRGIGRALALELARQNWNVATHYTEAKAEADSLAKVLGSAFAGSYQCDLSDPSNASGLLANVLAGGPLDALVNNAGVYLPLDFLTSGDVAFEANWRKTFTVNFESPMLLTRLASRHFLEVGGGKILNVASRVGFKGEGGASLYAASKAALINLTRSLAVELAPRNIQLFGIAPGWVDTAMARDGMDDRLPEILASIPLSKMASPEDCASTGAFLLSDAATYLSGVTIDINGASYFH